MSSTSTPFLLTQVYSRRLLLRTPIYEPGTNPNTPVPGPVLSDPGTPEANTPPNSLDANVVMILAVLLCALICALGLNSIVRCALRCSSRVGLEPEPGHAIRLATAGVRRKALRAIPIMAYSPELKLHGSGSECAICLSDLVTGERIRVLPKCSHAFHVKCIDRWLMTRPSCPTCRQCLFTSAEKSSGCADAGRSGSGAVHSIVVPLEPEGFVHNYRESS
ncbi:uncharacterized protein A4U43_C09F1530 [Asparagus officinalis]|uniref:RING-type domain-containing protein n=1 Tax=Asparagus officinalis TaxID=4686 RepID=A0A5P1E4Z7_ASPOF|nr:RING-H2 finger protein ATL73-like [Asparagus officinalis]ONK57539.1 uncharacterized protein A4U43_C09F1530 [Asparagus officinalis]